MPDEILTIPRTGHLGSAEIGRLSYGCWRFATSTLGEARGKIMAALEIGANLIDTADIYGHGETGFGGAETRLGEVLASEPGLRDQTVLVTKGGIVPPIPYDNRKDYLIKACEASLSRLKVETIDLYLIHRPDLLASFDEIAEALMALRRSGKIREAGVSNYTVAQTRALQSKLDFDLAATQPEISPLVIEPLFDGTLDLAQELGMTPMAWSPLAGGRLMGAAGSDEKIARIQAELDRIADQNNCGRDAIILAWLLAHPANIVPIIGSQNSDRIRTAALAYDAKMSRRDWYAVLEASRGEKMP